MQTFLKLFFEKNVVRVHNFLIYVYWTLSEREMRLSDVATMLSVGGA